jgi:hypothetical protein
VPVVTSPWPDEFDRIFNALENCGFHPTVWGGIVGLTLYVPTPEAKAARALLVTLPEYQSGGHFVRIRAFSTRWVFRNSRGDYFRW